MTGTIPGAAAILGIAVLCLTFEIVRVSVAGAGRWISGDASRVILLGGVLACALAGIVSLVWSARRSQKILTKHLHEGELALAQTQAVLDTIRDGVLLIDSHGRIQSANPVVERLFGYPPAKLMGQSVSLLIPDRTVFQDRATFPRSVTTSGQKQSLQFFPIELNLSEMFFNGQQHLLAMVRDISDREQGAETLRQIGCGVAHGAGGDCTRNLLRELSQVLETPNAFLVEILGDGATMVAMLTLADRGDVRGARAFDLRNTVCAETLAKGFRFIPAEARSAFPEDSLLTESNGDAYAGLPLTDHRGRVLGIIGVLHTHKIHQESAIESILRIFGSRAGAEIERKRFEEALSAEKERLAVTLRSIGDACITLDNDGRIVMFNSVAERFTGWVNEDASGRLVGEVLHLVDERTRRRSQHLLQRIVSTGTTDGPNELNILISRENEERTVESSSSPIRDRLGRKLGAIIVLRDVTERLRAEEERLKAEKLESLGLVAGGIAHDFNNVLTGILGNVTLALAEKELPTSANQFLTAARKASQRAQELAGQLLTFSKGGAPIKQSTHLGQLLANTAQCAVAGSRTTCETQIAEGLWPVEVDPGQLSQVIANLTINAEQAMPTGGTICVTAENFELPIDSITLGLTAGRWVRFAIEDRGVGIPEQYMKKIFDPYFTTKPTGSGLGLAAAYSIVKNHGGIITVESTPSVGSTFSVYLPASEKAPEPATPPTDPSTPATATGRVLILDDEEVICMLVTCALEPLGYTVTEVQDGEQALKLYEEAMKEGKKFDLVISDLTMPGRMSGQEAIKRLRELDPSVCAIVSSGYANDPVMSRFEEFGFAGMIAKPYEIAALGRKVGEVLEKSRKPQVIYHSFEARKTA